jgi:hypothetical protein
MGNIQDVTDSPKDWEDFWENEDIVVNLQEGVGGAWKTTKHDRYVDSVMNGGVICKRESMLSD